MRVYLTIIAIALLLLAALWATASLWVGNYLGTEEFRQTAFVEIGSFIATSAVVGGLSAAVAEYLRQRELRPLRRRAFDRLDIAVRAALDALIKIMTEGPDQNDLAFRKGSGGTAMPVIAKQDYKVRLPRRAHSGLVKTMWRRINSRISDIHRVLDRFTASFAIDRQDDLAVVEQFFDTFRERMNPVAYLLGDQPGGYRSVQHDRKAVRNEYEALRDAMKRIARDCGATSVAAERIDSEIDFLADDARHATRAACSMDPDHPQATAIALSVDMWFDFSSTLDELESRIVARVPPELFGDVWVDAISTWDANDRFDSRTVSQWQRDYPPPRSPDLKLVE